MHTSAILTIDRGALLQHFRRVRQASIEMCCSLHPEDLRVQPMEDVSPPWWNLGHTSWFFARNALATFFQFALPPFQPEKPPVDNWQTSAWLPRSPSFGSLPAVDVKDDHFD